MSQEASIAQYFGVEVSPGTKQTFAKPITETYAGQSIEMPVGIINGAEDGPVMYLSGGVHGNELNGVAIVGDVYQYIDPELLSGTIVCLPIINTFGLIVQSRYTPVYDRDLNRSFTGSSSGSGGRRIAAKIWDECLSKCDFGVDFHTSTRGRRNMFYARGDLENDEVAELVNAIKPKLAINKQGPSSSLRRAATKESTPTVSIEAGQALRFEDYFITKGIQSVFNVLSQKGMFDFEREPITDGETIVIDGWDNRTWIRADAGGFVDTERTVGEEVEEGDTLYTIQGPFGETQTEETANSNGLIVSIVKNPLVYPGNPVCHFVKLP